MSKIKIHIAYWVSHYFSGGDKSVYSLVEQLDKNKYKIFFIFFKQGEFTEYIKNNGFEYVVIPLSEDVYYINKKNIFFNIFKIPKFILELIKSAKRLADFIETKNIDIIHTNNIKPSFIGLFTKLFTKFRLFVHFRGANTFRVINYLYLIFADEIICISKFVKEKNFGDYDFRKVKIIYNGINLNSLNIKKNRTETIKSYNISHITEKNLLVGVIGYFHRWKNYELFINAIKIVVENFENCRALIIGDKNIGDKTYFNFLKKMISEYNLETKIFFIGYRADMFDVINSLDIVVSSSVEEPFGRTIIESMALFKPVIATFPGGSAEIILDNSTGYLVPLNNPKIMAEKILLILKDKNLRDKFGANGRRRCEELFDIRIHHNLISALYEKYK